jgi:hypothetical protein
MKTQVKEIQLKTPNGRQYSLLREKIGFTLSIKNMYRHFENWVDMMKCKETWF